MGTLGIGVGLGEQSSQMDTMFGEKGYISTNDMLDTQALVIKKFRDIVVKQLRWIT